MNLIDMQKTLERIKTKNLNFEFILNEATSSKLFEKVENQLGLTIPEKTKHFYKVFNGLKTQNPQLTVFAIEDWKKNTDGLIHFATFNNSAEIFFDTRRLNQADQWTITNPASNYEITLSMSSFWSNKIWHWIKDQKEIWQDQFWIKK